MILYYGQDQLTGKRKRSDGDEHMESRRKIARVTNSPSCETGEGFELPVCAWIMFTGLESASNKNIIACMCALFLCIQSAKLYYTDAGRTEWKWEQWSRVQRLVIHFCKI